MGPNSQIWSSISAFQPPCLFEEDGCMAARRIAWADPQYTRRTLGGGEVLTRVRVKCMERPQRSGLPSGLRLNQSDGTSVRIDPSPESPPRPGALGTPHGDPSPGAPGRSESARPPKKPTENRRAARGKKETRAFLPLAQKECKKESGGGGGTRSH